MSKQTRVILARSKFLWRAGHAADTYAYAAYAAAAAPATAYAAAAYAAATAAATAAKDLVRSDLSSGGGELNKMVIYAERSMALQQIQARYEADMAKALQAMEGESS